MEYLANALTKREMLIIQMALDGIIKRCGIPALSETMRSSAGLDDRRRKVLFRAWHRGMREMDYVLGTFTNAEIENLDEQELDQFEELMQEPDPEMYKWLSGSVPVPAAWDVPIVNRIRKFHLGD